MAVNIIQGTNAVNNFNNIGSGKLLNDTSSENKISFSEYLSNSIDQVNQLQIESEKLGTDLAAGKTDNIHQVMIAAEKADLALQFTMQIRNKVLDAYSEIMRMQI